MEEKGMKQQRLPLREVEEQYKKYEQTIEALLFTMGKAVSLTSLATAIEAPEETARESVRRLMERYEKEERPIHIIELEGCFQMCTGREYYDALIRVAKAPKRAVLGDAVLETLSIVAYKQPVTRAEIDHIRGVSSGYAVNKLEEFGLIYEVGRLDAPGRPALFATTEEFLRRFGIDSKQNLELI